MRVGVVQTDCHAVFRDGPVQIASGVERVADVVMRLGIVRVEAKRRVG